MSTNATQPDIAARLDGMPVTWLHVATTAVCAAGFVFDLMEIALGSVLSAVFTSAPYSISSGQLSLLLAAVYVGAIVGAPLLGWWADWHGRRNTLMVVLLWLAAMSFGAAVADSVGALTLVRMLAGIALGAYPPLMMAYLTDILPPRHRGMLVLVLAGIASLGPVAGIFTVRALGSAPPLGVDAWRWGFILGGMGAAMCGLLFRWLPESPRWLAARGRARQAEQACAKFETSRVMVAPTKPAATASPAASPEAIPAGPIGRRRLLVGSLFLLSPWSTVAFPLLTGAILTQRGYKLSDALLYVGLSNFGPLVGALVSAVAIDRIDRKRALACCAAGMLLCGAGFVVAQAPAWLIATSIGFSLCGFLYISAINLYAAELFPTAIRASTIAGTWALNRLGAAVAPLLLLPLMRTGGVAAMFTVIAATLAGALVLLWFGPAGQQRRGVA